MSSFTITTHQLWSCHMTLTGNLENFYFQSNFALMIGKVTSFWENWLKNKKVKSKKKNAGWKTPPSPSTTTTSAYRIKKMYLDTVI